MKLKNLETGFVFNVSPEVAEEFTEKDRKLFEIVDENYTPPKTTEVKTTMFDSVVKKDSDPNVDNFINKVLDDGLETMDRQELREYCKRNNIKYSVTWSKDKLLETIKG